MCIKNFIVNGEGKMKIYTTSPDAFEIWDKVANVRNFLVKNTGIVYAREVNVQIGPFPDYVFSPNYKLRSLPEIEKYIKGEGGYLVMSDGGTIDVARNKKEVLLKKLLPYKE